MSYLMSDPRAYHKHERPPTPPPQHPRVQTSQAALTQHQYHPQHTLPTPQSSTRSPPYATNHQQLPVTLPKVGQIRCYWSMLSSDLQFLYLDPVLTTHLEEQADLLVGKPLLSFIHPDEQASAQHDLGEVLKSKTVHGSVTRVRFCRLSKVRRLLGYEGPPPDWSDAIKIVLDDEYMAVDLVINWAAEGLVLCFIHASIDIDPNADNNEQHKTGWTNWCGTPWMPQEQIETLYRRLLMCIPQTGSMSRVFQVLSNERDRSLLLSWPPDAAQCPTSREFAKLVENVEIGVPGGNDAKTSCTRRYKAEQVEHPVFGGPVESIFTPHGTIIFACHKVDLSPRSSNAATMHQLGYASNYSAAQNSPYYDQGTPYALPPLSPQNQVYNNGYISQQGPGVQAPYSPQRWAQTIPPNQSSMRSESYPSVSPTQTNQQWPSAPPSPAYVDGGPSPFNRSLSPQYANYPQATASNAGASPISDTVPPPRRRISPNSSRDQTGPIRTAGNRPTGVQKCSSCKATSSPEWRKGPSGKKELCNACGLRYARSRAKKEGPNQTQRRRKEKTSKQESATPPSSTSAPAPARRSYADSSFSTSSTGSASGSDIYPHNGHHVLDTNTTPSPSPPASASSMNFVHYSPGGGPADSRAPYSGAGNTFVPVPSPLSGHHILQSQQQQQHPPPPSPQQQQHHHHHHHPGPTQLPPLEHISSYAGRISPAHLQSTSPLSHSSLASSLPHASYEREKQREREYRNLPPTPLSAEPRPRRSILTQQ